MRLAAIDIGTNSLHMVVVHVRPDLSFEVIDREKEMVRLGAGGLDGRPLTPEACRAALQVMVSFRRIADSHQVDRIVAVATSAVREAPNGGEFLRRVARQTGIRPRVVAGTEEAALIHRAAAYGVGGVDINVVIDIGGGSVEITRGAGSAEQKHSLKLGVIRLAERFVRTDPLSAADARRLERVIERASRSAIDEVKRGGFARVIATSGTALSLGAMIAAERGTAGASLRHRRLGAEQITRLRRRLSAAPLDDRLRLPGMDPNRADLSVVGAILLDVLVTRLGAPEIILCDLSLREGLILDYIARHRKEVAQADQYPDVRRRSVIELAQRCNYREEHARHVMRLALQLFDQTRARHGMTDREREWLEYAALLHDVGAHISYERHHRHSYYLIRNGGLRGFEPEEVEIIALLARHHRRATPKRDDDGVRELPKARRRTVQALAAMLRLAEALDRSHTQAVTGLSLEDHGSELLLQVLTSTDAALELWAAGRQHAPFQRMLGLPLRITVPPTFS